MSSYMGFDPLRLQSLASAMQRDTDELRRLRSSESAAAEPLRACARIADELEGRWLPLIRNLVGCGVLDGYRPANLDDVSLTHSYLDWLIRSHGFVPVTDPLDWTPSPMTPDHARVVGEWLASRGGEVSGADLDALARMLHAIATSPAASAAFVHGINGTADLDATIDATRLFTLVVSLSGI
ncbi:MAG TPA: hypothetical protein PLV68_07405, partial [Ilumatobacteraceae bacterium]|nr:hypothetical protein [Ilumatobacteraceae bacterium]